jgi:hypothetical protein
MSLVYIQRTLSISGDSYRFKASIPEFPSSSTMDWMTLDSNLHFFFVIFFICKNRDNSRALSQRKLVEVLAGVNIQKALRTVVDPH